MGPLAYNVDNRGLSTNITAPTYCTEGKLMVSHIEKKFSPDKMGVFCLLSPGQRKRAAESTRNWRHIHMSSQNTKESLFLKQHKKSIKINERTDSHKHGDSVY